MVAWSYQYDTVFSPRRQPMPLCIGSASAIQYCSTGPTVLIPTATGFDRCPLLTRKEAHTHSNSDVVNWGRNCCSSPDLAVCIRDGLCCESSPAVASVTMKRHRRQFVTDGARTPRQQRILASASRFDGSNHFDEFFTGASAMRKYPARVQGKLRHDLLARIG